MPEPVKPGRAAHIRAALPADFEAMNLLLKRRGMDPVDISQWQSYPFAEDFADVPVGWVLETADGEIVGTLSNVHLLYDLNGRRVRGTIAAAWTVDESFRGKGLHLTTTFFKQKGVDLLLNVSASSVASKVLTGLQIPRIPIPAYDMPCFWAANATAFAGAALRRRGAPAASLLALPAGLALTVRDILRGSGRGKPSSPVQRLRKFDDRFDALWKGIAAGPARLRVVRTRAVLEWKFRTEMEAGRAVVMTAGQGEDLSGYIVLARRAGSDIGMSLYDVADLQAIGDDPVILRDLLLAAVQVARDDGVDAVKFMTGTPAKRAPAMALKPYTYQLPFWQLYYKSSPELQDLLSGPEAWDFSLFDTY